MATWNVFNGGSSYYETFAALDETVQQPTTTSFYQQEGNYTLVFQGHFTLNMWGLITGGTITGFKGYVDGFQALNAYGYEMDYQAFNSAKQNAATNPYPLMDLLFDTGLTMNGSNNADELIGTELADVLSGYGGADEIDARDGNDFVTGGAGKDTMVGGPGVDTVSYMDRADPVFVVLKGDDTVLVKVGGVDEDAISGFENVIGGSGNDKLVGDGFNNMLVGMDGDDKLFGNDGNDSLSGADGRDKIVGGKGNDQLAGGDGNDVMTGGKDTDSFMFNTALDRRDNVDLIKDFKPGIDTIGLAHTVFTAFEPGELKGKNFKIGKKAKDGNDHIVYDDGRFFYDVDGAGGAKQIEFAKLKGAPEIDAGDFLVI